MPAAWRRAVRRQLVTRNSTGPDDGAPHADPAAEPIRQMPPRAYAGLVRLVLGREFDDADRAAYHPKAKTEIFAEIGRNQQLGVFTRLVASGASIEEAQTQTVRELGKSAINRHVARAFVLGMAQLPDGESLRMVGMGQLLHAMSEFERAWTYFAKVDPARLARLVPTESVTCAMISDDPESMAAAAAIADAYTGDDAGVLLDFAGRFLVRGEVSRATAITDSLHGRGDLAGDQRNVLRNLRKWTHPDPDSGSAALPADTIKIGVIDYHQPELERSSANVGDYVQTLAMLGNLARFGSIRFTGPDGLGELATELQGRVRPELRLAGGAADVHLIPVSRDYSSGDDLPDQTWMVAFGWHMHSTFRLGFGLPYDPRLNPLFVSFHLNRTGALTPEAIEYLKAHGPIGCRDWSTVYLLLSAGIDAFFTGCLTTTVGAVFPDLADVERAEPGVVGVIDLAPRTVKGIKKRKVFISHAGEEFRLAGLVEGTRTAIELLETYQKNFRRVVTSRLHSYLPATALGIHATFRPRFPAEVRFDGLSGLTPDAPALFAIRDGIQELLAKTLVEVVAGRGKDEVYAHWRELTAPLVAEARSRFEAPSQVVRPTLDLGAVISEIREAMVAYGPHDRIADLTSETDRVTDVTLSLDENFKHLLPVTVESLVTNASGPVRLWITTRGLDEAYQKWFAHSFPEVPITFVPFDEVDYGEITRMIRHISVATMDRLLLPEVLADLDRVTYVDIDTVTTGDICELAAIDLEGFALGARTGRQSAADSWRAAGNLLDPERSSDLRRVMAASHPFDFTMFNAGVLVLDLARMRADGFTPEFVPYAGTYGFNDQDILNAYAGADRLPLESRWNAFPVLEEVAAPGIVHYAGAGKPWEADLVPAGELWREYAARFKERAGEVPE
ncbi:MAG: glycosyltransferase family 8 protein [Nocardioides sp.]